MGSLWKCIGFLIGIPIESHLEGLGIPIINPLGYLLKCLLDALESPLNCIEIPRYPYIKLPLEWLGIPIKIPLKCLGTPMQSLTECHGIAICSLCRVTSCSSYVSDLLKSAFRLGNNLNFKEIVQNRYPFLNVICDAFFRRDRYRLHDLNLNFMDPRTPAHDNRDS